MSKGVGVIGLFGVGLLAFLIWNDPANAADVVGGFLSWLTEMLGDLWDRVTEFLSSL